MGRTGIVAVFMCLLGLNIQVKRYVPRYGIFQNYTPGSWKTENYGDRKELFDDDQCAPLHPVVYATLSLSLFFYLFKDSLHPCFTRIISEMDSHYVALAGPKFNV